MRRVTSISRCGVAGPRSLMRTSTCRPFSRLVSRATAGSCSVWCAAASAVWSNASPSAVRSAWPDRIDRREAGLLRLRSSRADSARRRRPDRARRGHSADWPAVADDRTPQAVPSGRAQRQPHATTASPEQPDHQRVVVRRVVAADRGEVGIDQERIARRAVRDQQRRGWHRRAPAAGRQPARTPSRAHSPTGRRLSRPAAVPAKFPARITAWPQGSPLRQPECAR